MRILNDYPHVPSDVLDIIVHHAGEDRTSHLVRELDLAGFQIVAKPDPRERVTRFYADGRVEIRTPEGERIAGRVVTGDEPDPAPKVGTVVMLTPEGERLVDAVAKGDLSRVSMGAYASLHELKERLVVPDIGSLFAGYVERPLTPGELKDLLTPEDFTGPIRPEKGAEATLPPGTQIHMGHTRGLDVPATSPWVLKEVIPGTVDIRANTKVADHEVVATATAVLTKADISDRRELTVRTVWFCSENMIESATTEALSLALRRAREAAAAFIAATSPAPATDTQEAA